MNTMNESPEQIAMNQEELNFLYQIKKELDLNSSKDAVKLVASVLHALRQTLALDQANVLLNKLPDFLKLTFATNWKQDEGNADVHHLDELVGLVMERDQKQRDGLFKNEVQTLTVIILTLKKLQKLIDIENFEGLKPAFRQELKGLPSTAAS